jgi:trehalose-6-phosphate synthase
MHQGLVMPLDERQDRRRRLIAHVKEHDIVHWRQSFVRALSMERPEEHAERE